MKFVCDKCRTKYSIADERVRRKVLKIRCKNCANIIVVREPEPSPKDSFDGEARAAFDAAFEDSFSGKPSGQASAGRSTGAVAAAARSLPPAEPAEFSRDRTELAATTPGALSEVAAHEDEWYLALDEHQFGPMSFAELCSRVKRGEARSESGEEAYCWRDGFDDWLEVTRVPELRPYVPPPPPRPRSGVYPEAESSRPLAGGMVAATAAAPPPIERSPAESPAPVPEPAVPTPAEPPPPLTSRQQGAAAGAAAMAPPPPPAGQAGAAAASAELKGVMEPGLVQLPTAFGDAPIGATSMPAAPVARSGAPLGVKIAAVGGVLSTVTGLALLVYFLAFDRPSKPPPTAPVAAAASPGEPPAERVASAQRDGEEDVLQFPPMEVERSRGGARAVRGQKAAARPGANGSAETPEPTADNGRQLTAEQKRLLALYGKSSGVGKVPRSGRRKRVRRGPSRRLRAADLAKVQRQNGRSLKACYERALKRDSSLSNVRIDVQLDIGDSGVVRSITLNGPKSVDLNSCLRRSIRRWVFPAVGAQSISFPLIFRGS